MTLSDLPQILGFSKPMLFAYRGGKNRITPKVWLKLERAERQSSSKDDKSVTEPKNAESEGFLNQSEWVEPENFDSFVREDEVPYRAVVTEIEKHASGGDQATLLERIAIALEKLVEIETKRNRRE